MRDRVYFPKLDNDMNSGLPILRASSYLNMRYVLGCFSCVVGVILDDTGITVKRTFNLNVCVHKT